MKQLSCAIAVLLCLVVLSGDQTTPAGSASEALRAHVLSEQFQPVTSIRGLPLGIRYELETLFRGQGLDIADVGAPFRANGLAGSSSLPTRRLVVAGCSIDHCVVYYERGGGRRIWRAALFHWTPAETRLEMGGTAPGGLKTVEAVRDLVLSASIKKADAW